MLNVKDIIKKLEELENNQEKINFLNKLLEEIDDEELINEIKGLIEELKESLESKLENIEIPVRKIAREMEIDDTELDVEQIQRNLPQRQTARPDLTIRQMQEDEDLSFSYSSNTNYANTQLYAPQLFDYQTLQQSFNNDFMKQNIVRESILNPETPLNEVERENLSRKLRESMPGASEENLLMYQAKISSEIKKDEKIKYVARLK